MSGSEQESKSDGKLVSIPLSSDDETSAGRNVRSSGFERPTYTAPSGNSALGLDLDEDEAEEKARLINQVLELQNTLDDLSQRVDAVKDENLKLKSENQVLGQYIENLMSASSVFQATNTAGKKRSSSAKPSSKKGDKK